MRTVLLMVLWMLLPLSVQAQESDQWIPRAIDNDWPGGFYSSANRHARYARFRHSYRAYQERVHERHVRELPAVRVESARYRGDERRYYDDRDRYDRREPRCVGRTISRVGEEKYGRERAKEAADTAWREEVRNRFGVRVMDLKNARGLTYECNQSATGNRASEKTAEGVGRVLEQCILDAEPCRAEREGPENSR